MKSMEKRDKYRNILTSLIFTGKAAIFLKEFAVVPSGKKVNTAKYLVNQELRRYKNGVKIQRQTGSRGLYRQCL